MRGQLLSFTSYDKWRCISTLSSLADRILQLENDYMLSPSDDIYKLLLESEFDNLSTINAEEMLIKSRHMYYEYGYKPSRLLAHQLRQSSASRLISEIHTSSGLTCDPQEINDAVHNLYASLYFTEQEPTSDDLCKFLGNLPIPKVAVDVAEILDSPITLEEVTDAIAAMQSGKSPGPDGYPIEFFKRFSRTLASLDY